MQYSCMFYNFFHRHSGGEKAGYLRAASGTASERARNSLRSRSEQLPLLFGTASARGASKLK